MTRNVIWLSRTLVIAGAIGLVQAIPQYYVGTFLAAGILALLTPPPSR